MAKGSNEEDDDDGGDHMNGPGKTGDENSG